MHAVRIEKLESKTLQCDIQTKTKNFFVYPDGVNRILVHNSPSVIAASNFYGKRFVSDKVRFFAKEHKIATTSEEVQTYFGHSPDLATKMLALLHLLDDIAIPQNQIWQGDFLFGKSDLKKERVGDGTYIIFHPNTIVYAVPLNDPMAARVANAQIGVAWHTRYKGTTFDDLRISFDVSAEELKETPEAVCVDPKIPNLAGKVTLTEEETRKVDALLERISHGYEDIRELVDYIPTNEEFQLYLMTYENEVIRSYSRQFASSSDQYVKDFFSWVEERYKKEIAGKKRPETQKTYSTKMETILGEIDRWGDQLGSLIEVQKLIVVLKEFFINKLDSLPHPAHAMLKTLDKGFIPTGQEGFAVSDTEGNIQKLVSRLTFSFSNWSKNVVKGWMSDKRQQENSNMKRNFNDFFEKIFKEKVTPSTFTTIDMTAKKMGLQDPPKGENKPTSKNLKYYDPQNKREDTAEELSDQLEDKGIEAKPGKSGRTPAVFVADDVGDAKIEVKDLKGLTRSSENPESIEMKHFSEFEVELKKAIQLNRGRPLTLHFTDGHEKTSVTGVTGIMKVPGVPKADWALLNKKGEPFFYISHKAGTTARHFQQWGGFKGLENYPDIRRFIKYVEELFPSKTLFPTFGTWMPITDKNLGEQLKAKAIFGLNFGETASGVENVDAALQGHLKLEAIDPNKGIYSVPIAHLIVSPNIPKGDYEPVLIVTFRNLNSNIGFKDTRFGIWPYDHVQSFPSIQKILTLFRQSGEPELTPELFNQIKTEVRNKIAAERQKQKLLLKKQSLRGKK